MKKEPKVGGKRRVRFADESPPDKMTKDKKPKDNASEDNQTRRTRDNVGEDISRMLAELTPGKKGGEFPLPFGGLLSVPPGTLGKRDVITVCQVSPSDRHKYIPPLQNGECLLSELYLLGSSGKGLRNQVRLRFPVVPEDLDLYEMSLLRKPADGDSWTSHAFSLIENQRSIELEAEATGIFAVISTPRRERFEIPVQGCLYNARLHRNISVRFPKKATDVDMTCDIMITPLNASSIAVLRQEFHSDMVDLVLASPFYDIRPSIDKEYRRAVTVKLPLPPLDEQEFSEEDLVVMEVREGSWQLFEGQLKFTKATVQFDTRHLSKYCIALSRPNRKRRLTEAFKHIQEENEITRGELLPFLHVKEKSWTLWFDLVPVSRSSDVINKRLREGFRVIRKTEFQNDEEENESPVFRRHWRSRAKSAEPSKPKRTDLDLSNGCSFELEVGGDIRICREDPGRSFMNICYQEKLNANYRKFKVEPLPLEEPKRITAVLRCFTNKEKKECVRTFDFDIELEAVNDYFYVEPEPEPEPEPEVKEPEEVIEIKPEAPPPSPRPDRFSTPMTQSFMRLIRPMKPPRRISKESKVLTGKSLMCLAREVEQGLTLAIYLDISDSAITGMGFDALATGLGLVDMTYRILLLWKRRTSKYKDKQVEILASALQDMGRNDAAMVVLERHKQNRELSPDCFVQVEA